MQIQDGDERQIVKVCTFINWNTDSSLSAAPAYQTWDNIVLKEKNNTNPNINLDTKILEAPLPTVKMKGLQCSGKKSWGQDW